MVKLLLLYFRIYEAKIIWKVWRKLGEQKQKAESRAERKEENKTQQKQKKNKQVKITVVRARFLKRKIHTLTNKTWKKEERKQWRNKNTNNWLETEREKRFCSIWCCALSCCCRRRLDCRLKRVLDLGLGCRTRNLKGEPITCVRNQSEPGTCIRRRQKMILRDLRILRNCRPESLASTFSTDACAFLPQTIPQRFFLVPIETLSAVWGVV